MPIETQDFKISLKADGFSTKTLATIEKTSLTSMAAVGIVAGVKALVQATAGKKTYTGYVEREVFDSLNVSTVPIPQNFAGLEAVDVPTRLQEQLFRIYEVEESEDYVTVHARHVWYDNLQNYTTWEPTEETQYTGAAVCRNILSNAVSPVDSNVASDCTDTKPGSEFDYARKNIVECFLDPENGVCAKFGLSLIRYNWDFYCLKNVGFDRGYVIQDKKNLLGVVRTESIENLATRIVPIGMNKQGEIVWLNNNGLRYVDSQYINDYSKPRVEIYDTGLRIGQDDVTAENINEKLLQAAQRRFTEDKVDLPEITMTINFLSIGDTEEYAQYRGLDKVYLFDIVTIKDTTRGYEYSAQVVGVEHDILTGMLTSITLGTITNSDGVRKIASWQVPEVSGENIRLKTIMAGAFQPGAINGDDIANGAVGWVHINAASISQLTTDQLEALQANIHDLIAGSITADDITAGSITTALLAADAVTADKIAANAVTAQAIAAGSVDANKISAGAITAQAIASGAVTTAALFAGAVTADKIASAAITADKIGADAITANKIAANAVTADKIAANAITADKISATAIDAINAKLGIANIANAQIASADINYAHVKDLAADTAIFSTTITDQGVADRLYINRLLITYGQMVEATIGDLVIGASDGKYYHIDVEWTDGVPSLVPTRVQTPTASEIAAGHTTGGQTIIGNIGTFAELSSENFYAINSIIDRITARRIDVDELWARQAFINKLMVQDISSNTYIQSTIGNWQSGSTITQTINTLTSRIQQLGYGAIYYSVTEPPHDNLQEGDIWIEPVADNTWGDIAEYTWGELAGMTWAQVAGQYRMYVWEGTKWKILYDNLIVSELTTEIQQTAYAVTLKADKSVVDVLSGQVQEFSATLEVQAEQIQSAVSSVNSKSANYTRTTDPSTDSSIHLNVGDTWTKTIGDGTWGSLKQYTWGNLKSYTWNELAGASIYTWNGSKWIKSADYGQTVQSRTLITQTASEVEILAEETSRIGDDLYQQKAALTVANDHISQEVSRALAAESAKLDKTSQYQTADSIVTEAVRQSASAAAGSYVTKTSTLQTANQIVTEAVRQSASAASGAYVTKTSRLQTADSIVTEAVNQAATSASGAYLAKTSSYQTADSIVTEAVRQAGVNAGSAYIAKTSSYQSATAIVNEAVRQAGVNAGNNYLAKTSSYQTADSIVTEAVRQSGVNASSAYIAKTSSYQTADSIVTEAVRQAGVNAGNSYIAKTSTYQSATSIVNEAVTQAGTAASSAYIAKTSTYQTAESIVSKAQSYTDGKLTSYSTTTQTNNLIASYVTNNAYKLVSGISITAQGVDVSGSQYVNIASGGTFKVTTGNFLIDTSVSNTGYVMLSGSTTASNAKFRLKKDGSLTITKLLILDKDNNETEVNLRTAGLWKLSGNTITQYTVSGGAVTSMTLSNGTTVNFKNAASFMLNGYWSGDKFYVDMTDASGATVYKSTDSGAITVNKTNAEIKAEIEGNTHQSTISVDNDEGEGIRTIIVDARGVYSAGETAGYNDGYSVGYSSGEAAGERKFSVVNPNLSGALYDANGKFVGAGNWYLSYGAALYGKTS